MFDLWKNKHLLKQYVVVITVNLVVICLGFGIAWPSPVIVKLSDPNNKVLGRPITSTEISWVVSVGFLCAFLVNVAPAYLADRFGRKTCIFLGAAPKVIVGLLYVFATDVWMLVLGRAINGVADGLLFTVVPMYSSEIASKEIRGGLGTILQIFSSIGILLMFSIGPFISYIAINIVYLCGIIATMVPLLYVPESPYILYTKGRESEAIKVLITFRGSKALAEEEIKVYENASTKETVNKSELLKNKVFLKTVAIVVTLGIGGQIVGFNAVSFYLQTILESTNSSIRAEFMSVIIGLIQLTASLCTTFITDRFGRKPILCTTFIGMGTGMFGLGTFFYLREDDYVITGFLNYLPILSLGLVIYCYSAGFGSINWMLMTELFEGPARAIGVNFGIMTTTLAIFITTHYFPVMSEVIGPVYTYYAFGVCCVLFCLFIWLCVPETKGRSFSEIQVALGAKRIDNLEKNEMGESNPAIN